MKRISIGLVAIVICAGITGLQAQDKAGDTKKMAAPANAASDELKQLENDWVEASKTRNADKLGEILADSWAGTGWDGKTTTRARALADLKAPGNSLDSIEMGPMKVRVFGNTAVVTGSDTEKSMENGKDTSGKYLWIDVFVKQGGKWKAVASQSTRLAK